MATNIVSVIRSRAALVLNAAMVVSAAALLSSCGGSAEQSPDAVISASGTAGSGSEMERTKAVPGTWKGRMPTRLAAPKSSDFIATSVGRVANGWLVLYPKTTTSQQQTLQYISSNGFTLVGFGIHSNAYQVKLPQLGAASLQEAKSAAELSGLFDSVSFERQVSQNAIYTPIDEDYATRPYPWNHEAIKVRAAWGLLAEQNRALPEISIGVIDFGFSDASAYDIHLASVLEGSSILGCQIFPEASDCNPHGYHVAGIIGAKGNNEIGGVGIGSGVTDVAISAAGGNQTGTKVIEYLMRMLVEKQPRIINLSLGNGSLPKGGEGAEILNYQAVREEGRETANVLLGSLKRRDKLWRERGLDPSIGTVFVQAAGNAGAYYFINADGTRSSPPAEDNGLFASMNSADDYYRQNLADKIIIVGATDSSRSATMYTQRASGTLAASYILAPGSNIKSNSRIGRLELSGTSMAAPHVSGVLALLFQANISLSAEKARQIVISTADNGKLDAEAAVKEAIRLKDLTTPTIYVNADQPLYAYGQTFTAQDSTVAGLSLYIGDPSRPLDLSGNSLSGSFELQLYSVGPGNTYSHLKTTILGGPTSSLSGLVTLRFGSVVNTVPGQRYFIGIRATDAFGIGLRSASASTYGGGAEAWIQPGNLAVIEHPSGRDLSFSILSAEPSLLSDFGFDNTLADAFPSRQPLTLIGATSPSFTTRGSSPAISLPGGQYLANANGLLVPAMAADGNHSFSVTTWVRFDTWAPQTNAIVYERAFGGLDPCVGPTYGISNYNNFGGRKWLMLIGTRNDQGQCVNEELWSTVNGSLGQWYHVAATYDQTSGQVRLYVNAQIVAEKTIARRLSLPARPYLTVGQQPWGGNQFINGAVDDLKFYRRALSNDEVKALADQFEGDSPSMSFVETFNPGIVDTNRWNNYGYRDFGEAPLATAVIDSSGIAQFPAWAALTTKDKVSFSGKKIVIEARMGGVESRFILAEGLNPAQSLIMLSNTPYCGWGMNIQARGPFRPSGPNGGCGSDIPVILAGNYSSAMKEYRLTIDGDRLVAESGPSLTDIRETLTTTLGSSIYGRSFFLSVGTGAVAYSPGSVDWVRITTTK